MAPAAVPDAQSHLQKKHFREAGSQRKRRVDAFDFHPRKRFSLAHELGHAELDYLRKSARSNSRRRRALSYCSGATPRIVLEIASPSNSKSAMLANKFASYLLVPCNLARDLFRKYGDAAECADQLQVSKQAMMYRLKHLDLV